jgi:hypothetical protein
MRMRRGVLGLVGLAAMCLLGCEGPSVEVPAGEVRFSTTDAAAMHAIYTEQARQGTPTLITSDSVLHTAHVLFDYTLRAAETGQLAAAVETLTVAMAARMTALADEEAHKQYIVAPPPYGYDRVAAYFWTAQRLLHPEAPVPARLRALVEPEVARILAHREVAVSPILGVTEDYTQYVPRGHYTRNAAFERYFRAMMWYGRAGFAVSGEQAPGGPLTREEARANAWAGMTLARGLATTTVPQDGRQVPALALWERAFRTIEFLIGPADDLTPPEYLQLIRQVFGETLPGAWLPETQAQTDRFIAAAVALRPPRIVGTVQTGATPPVALRLFGQRFVPDALIFQQLVAPHVPGRTLPSGLDVMAVLGSAAAEARLRARGDFARPDYGRQLTALRQAQATQADRPASTAYIHWLRAIGSLVGDPTLTGGPPPTGSPGSARPAWWTSPAWGAKQLNAGLGGWAALRHDTLLYVKQSYTTRASGAPPTARVVYVEPVPQLYGGLLRLLAAVREEMTRQGTFPEALGANYDTFTRLLRALLLVSTRESLTAEEAQAASVEAPTAADRQLLQEVGALLAQAETLPPPLRVALTGEEDAQVALIADVHTDATVGRVLEVGVGPVGLVSVPVTLDGAVVTVAGPIFTYYEFTEPMTNRLTDAAWQARLARGEAPAPVILGEWLGRE